MKRVLILFCAALIFVSVSSGAFAQQNNLAFFMIDSVVGEAGFQGGSLATGIGADQLVGFTVYVKNTDQLRGFEIDVTWDGAKATWRSASGLRTESDTIVMNGAEISLPDEANILDPGATPLGELKETGHYFVNPSKVGGDAVATSEYGMLFFVMLKTAATFTTDQDFTVTAAVTTLNDGGIKKYLGVRTLYVNGETDVKSSTWGEIKSQFKD